MPVRPNNRRMITVDDSGTVARAPTRRTPAPQPLRNTGVNPTLPASPQKAANQVSMLQAIQGVVATGTRFVATLAARAFEAQNLNSVQRGANGNRNTASQFMFANEGAGEESDYLPRNRARQQQPTVEQRILSSTVVINMIDVPEGGINEAIRTGEADYLPRNFRSELCMPPRYMEGCSFVNVSLGTIVDGGVLTHNHFGHFPPEPSTVNSLWSTPSLME